LHRDDLASLGHFFSTFHRKATGAMMMPSRLLRYAVGTTNCPVGMYGTSFVYASMWISSANFFWAARSGALNQASTSSSSFGSLGQPNHALSPLLRSGMLRAGDSISGADVQVWNRFQPPLSIGSFEARRVISVPQSL